LVPYEAQSDTLQGLKVIGVLVIVGGPPVPPTIDFCQSFMINLRGVYPRFTSFIETAKGNSLIEVELSISSESP
jgi:hypothetical protein